MGMNCTRVAIINYEFSASYKIACQIYYIDIEYLQNNSIFVYVIVHIYVHKIKDMIVINPTQLRNEQKKYLDMAEKEPVVIKRGDKLIHLIVKERLISDEDIKNSLTREELMQGVSEDIRNIYSRKK